MAISLKDLIRAVRACKTAAEEREVIAKESAALREAFRDQDNRYRHRNVAKLMYIHMLGCPTHFGQMETLKLIAANGFPEKRIGYLGLMILLDERQEVLMLVTNSLKLDLNHKNQYIIGLALAALGNICSADMARDLAPEVEKLLELSNPYIRKKAALCAIRICKKVHDLVDMFIDPAAQLINDKNHSVILTGVSLMHTICELDPSVIPQYRKHVPTLCKIQKSLLQSGFSPEHDVAGITDPFLQVKLLRLMRVLGAGDVETSDYMNDILAQVATNIEGSRNAGNAILYEAVTTIMGIAAGDDLRKLAVNILGRFLANKDNNIRYVALNTLARVVGVDTQAVQRHRATIVDCVKDADVSIRRRALELVYSLVNENNIRTLTRELIEYVVISDAEFKPDLTSRICTLITRYAPDKRWHVDSLVAVMVQAGAHVKEEVCRSLIVLITNSPDLQAYSARLLYRSVKENMASAELALLLTALWVIGEFGELLLPGQGGPLLEGESALTLSEVDIVALLETLAHKKSSPDIVREYAAMAAMKLTARLPSQMPRLRALIEGFQRSAILEVQQRSSEFSRMFGFERMLPALLERMPALDEQEYARNMAGEVRGAAQTAGQGAAYGGSTGAAAGGDLLDVGDLGEVGSGGGAAAGAQAGGVHALEELLGLDLGAAPAASASSSAGGAPPTAAAILGGGVDGDLLDLLGGGGGMPTQHVSSGGMAQAPLDSLLGGPTGLSGMDMLGNFTAASAPVTAPVYPPITVYQKNGVTVSFAFERRAHLPQETVIHATYTNSSPSAVEDFTLQAAVPKFMTITISPASSTSLPPLSYGSATQNISVNNTMHGQKRLQLRLRISYTLAGVPMQDMVEVNNFPNGL